jgi:glycerol-3-phosphate dehydrogenase
VPKDRRSVFVVPHGEFTYIGTTDTDYDGPVDDPQCTAEDIAYLLGAINAASTETLTVDDIVGSWAGLRPLVKAAASGRTADLSRKHKVARSRSGLVTITGGKLTTYREMAADTVDEIVADVLTLRPGATQVGDSVTKKLRLRGAAGYDTLDSTAAVHPTIGPELRQHLGDRFGGEARVLMAAISEDPTMAEPIVAGLPYVRAEVLFAVRHEMAGSVGDVLSRRTRAQLYGRDDSGDAADAVAELMAPELGWTAEQAAASAEAYRADLAHERQAAGLPETHLAPLLGADA